MASWHAVVLSFPHVYKAYIFNVMATGSKFPLNKCIKYIFIDEKLQAFPHIVNPTSMGNKYGTPLV